MMDIAQDGLAVFFSGFGAGDGMLLSWVPRTQSHWSCSMLLLQKIIRKQMFIDIPRNYTFGRERIYLQLFTSTFCAVIETNFIAWLCSGNSGFYFNAASSLYNMHCLLLLLTHFILLMSAHAPAYWWC